MGEFGGEAGEAKSRDCLPLESWAQCSGTVTYLLLTLIPELVGGARVAAGPGVHQPSQPM